MLSKNMNLENLLERLALKLWLMKFCVKKFGFIKLPKYI